MAFNILSGLLDTGADFLGGIGNNLGNMFSGNNMANQFDFGSSVGNTLGANTSGLFGQEDLLMQGLQNPVTNAVAPQVAANQAGQGLFGQMLSNTSLGDIGNIGLGALNYMDRKKLNEELMKQMQTALEMQKQEITNRNKLLEEEQKRRIARSSQGNPNLGTSSVYNPEDLNFIPLA